ncbi:MAG TPA: aldo/keto reductase [Terriglobia bacterium]|nr:aldo/keto reductase [Terriglobia bacterium]
MKRRDFLKQSTAAAAGLAAAETLLQPLDAKKTGAAAGRTIPHRPLGKTGEHLSIVAMGGIVVMDVSQPFANKIVAEAVDRGINYIDIAPSYGNAQERLGPALKPYRNRVFLACKELARDKAGAQKELDGSLRQLQTDHVDLYQLHALTKVEEVHKALGPGGAIEAFVAAKKAGKVRFLGFSAHSAEAALTAMDQFDFDTVLFPINFVMYSQANFGPQIVQRAREKQMGMLAIKAMAKTVWLASEKKHHPYDKCWYKPAALPQQAELALRWTLSQPVTAAIPPGDINYFRLAMDVAERFSPVNESETKTLMAQAKGLEPLFPRRSA